MFAPDIQVFEDWNKVFNEKYGLVGSYYGAPIYNYKGKEVIFWRTTETSINSYNYFIDGTVSKEYFVVEGYERNCARK
jgi:hypothetical protein